MEEDLATSSTPLSSASFFSLVTKSAAGFLNRRSWVVYDILLDRTEEKADIVFELDELRAA